MTPLPSHRIARQSRDYEAAVDQVHPFLEGSVPLYVLPRNIVAFLAAFWTAVIYAVATRHWLGAILWLTVGFLALTSERLTPTCVEDDDTLR